MTNQRRKFDSAADAQELAELDRRAQELDRERARICDERRDLHHRRRRIYDRMRKRGLAAALQAAAVDASDNKQPEVAA